jgi:hypothetical protein
MVPCRRCQQRGWALNKGTSSSYDCACGRKSALHHRAALSSLEESHERISPRFIISSSTQKVYVYSSLAYPPPEMQETIAGTRKECLCIVNVQRKKGQVQHNGVPPLQPHLFGGSLPETPFEEEEIS